MPAFDIVKIVLKLFYSLFTVTKDKKKKKKKKSKEKHLGLESSNLGKRHA